MTGTPLSNDQCLALTLVANAPMKLCADGRWRQFDDMSGILSASDEDMIALERGGLARRLHNGEFVVTPAGRRQINSKTPAAAPKTGNVVEFRRN
jgi:hypothetical protein